MSNMKPQTLEELIKIFRHNFPHLYDLYVDREQSGSFSEGENAEVFIKKVYEAGQEAERERCLELMTTHTEHDGSYCDTGEDMEWACRSECVEMAVKRITKST